MKYFLVLTLIFLSNCKTENAVEGDKSADILATTDVKTKDARSDVPKDNKKDLASVKDTAKDVIAEKDTNTKDCGDEQVVRFKTSDDVELVADYHPPQNAGKGAVILFHMIPPNFNRTSYPSRVRNAFSKEGYTVLNVDRRGAGQSGGVAKDAYAGPKGRLDVEAAVEYLLSDERKCGIDRDKLMLVGASNGTTSVMDYTTGRSNMTLPDPKAIAWLSPGGYTESQNKIEENKALLEALPVLIIHPKSEPWAVTYESFSEKWTVLTLENGLHGTGNFDDGALEALQLPALIKWAQSNIGD